MSESLYGMLVALSLLAAYRLFEAVYVGRAIVLGALLGLAALTPPRRPCCWSRSS